MGVKIALPEYKIADENDEVFTIDELGTGDSVNVRDGNNVNYDIDNLTNRYDRANAGSQKSDDDEPKTLAVPLPGASAPAINSSR